MNMIDIQDKLKGLSEQQLVSEMQSPTGNAPQFLVLSEITRRKRMRDSFQNQQAQPTTSIAEEAVASAGVPGGGLAAMARSLAPNSSMAQNTAAMPSQPMPEEQPVQGMYGGGYVQKMAIGGQPADMSNPMVSAWVRREAQRRGVSVEEVMANLGPTGAAISEAAPSMDARNRMLGLEPSGPSNLNFPTQSDLDQRYADTQRGDTFRMPSQEDLDLRYLGSQGQQPIFPDSGFSPDPADTLAPMLDRIQTQSRMTATEPPEYVDLDLTSQPAPSAETPDTVLGIDPYTGKYMNVPTPGKMLSDAGEGISDAASYLWDSIGTYRGDPYSELSEAEMAALQSGSLSPEAADALQSSRLAAAERLGPTELQNPALRGSVTPPAAPAEEQQKPPAPPKDTVPQGGGISTDTAGVTATPNPATSAAGRGAGAAVGGSNAPTSYEQELRDAMIRAEKRASQDKWLALAQVGMQLMSSKEPTLGGALGEAGIAGLQSYRGSRDAYENERLGLTKSLYDLQQQQAAAIAAQRAAAAKAIGKPKTIEEQKREIENDLKFLVGDDGFGREVIPDWAAGKVAELRQKYVSLGGGGNGTFDASAP